MKQLSLLFTVICLFAFPSAASADIAPPYNPDGVNPQPGSEITQVRMVAETVLIQILDEGELGRARVTADFTMLNLGTESESMAVRFPISGDNGRGEYPEIKDVIINLEGQQIPYRRAIYPLIQYKEVNLPWAEFDVTFPPAKDLKLQVSYTLDGSGYYPYTAFAYVLETGAGWKDTIGSADVIMRLPYPVNSQNFVEGDYILGWAGTTRGGVVDGNEVHWHFEDFEPGLDGPVSHISFSLASPKAWNMVLTEQGNIAKHPEDGEAWGRLAKAYKELFFLTKDFRRDAGGLELYQSSVEAYEKCLSLDPNDAQWHAGFADLLAHGLRPDGEIPTLLRALEEIHTALQLAPNDPVVLEMAESIRFSPGMVRVENSYDFPWLTQTPASLPWGTITPSVISTSTSVPTQVQATATTWQPVDQSPTSSPCAAAMLAPLTAFLWLGRKKLDQT